MTDAPAIRVRGATVAFGDRPALRQVDLDVATGEVVALLGPNGSGKSTLIRAILGLTPLAAGAIELFGVPAARFKDRGRLGYVPQRHTVGGGVPSTVQEVVSSGRLSRRPLFAPFLGPFDREVVCDAIATVGLTEKLTAPVSTLSGGQQRRALIARALAGQPDVLIMDEPFAGVDAPNQQILARTLGDLVERGVTLLLVTHEIGPIAALLNRAVVLSHGHVVHDGAPDQELLDRYGNGDPHAGSPSPTSETVQLGNLNGSS